VNASALRLGVHKTRYAAGYAEKRYTVEREVVQMTRQLEAPLKRSQVQAIYDRVGRRYDLLRFAEAAPKRGALALLSVQPGERVLEVGVGTGAVLIELARSVTAGFPAGQQPASPLVSGLDLSPVMLEVARARLDSVGLGSTVELRKGDACALPYEDQTFDALFSSYVFDLLPTADIARALAECYRILRPGGRSALISLSPGRGAGARLFTTLYERLYRRRPAWFAGCRPLSLAQPAATAGFTICAERSWFRGHPSEAIFARKEGCST